MRWIEPMSACVPANSGSASQNRSQPTSRSLIAASVAEPQLFAHRVEMTIAADVAQCPGTLEVQSAGREAAVAVVQPQVDATTWAKGIEVAVTVDVP